MPKRITLLQRRRDRSAEQFSEYWSTTHAEIAKGLPGVVRYLQNHVVAGAESGVDGIVELWFEDGEAAMAGFASEVADRLVVDEPNFLDGLTGCAYAGPDAGPGEPAPWKAWLFGSAEGAEPLSEASAWAAAHPGAIAAAVDLREQTAPLLRRDLLDPIPALPDIAVSLGFASRQEAERFAETAPDAPPAGLRLAHVLVSRTVRIV